MSTHDQEHIAKTTNLSFEGTDVRHVIVDGMPMDVNEKTYQLYVEAGADIKEIPHSGKYGETPGREFDNTTLPEAVAQAHVRTDNIPVTPVPPEHDDLSPNKQPGGLWTRGKKITAGVVALATLAGIGYGVKQSSDRENDPQKNSSIEGVTPLNVDGNTYPDKANPADDKKYGIYDEIASDGTIKDPQDFLDRTGFVTDYQVPLDVGYDITMTGDQIEDIDKFEIYDQRSNILNKFAVPNLEAGINLINMNNEAVRLARSSNKDLSEDERLLLKDTDLLSGPLGSILNNSVDTDHRSSGLPGPAAYQILTDLSPRNAGLHATVCPFDDGETPTPEICIEAQNHSIATGGDDVEYSTFSERLNPHGGSALEVIGDDTRDTYAVRSLWGEVNLGVVWSDAKGKVVDEEKISIPVRLWVNGVHPFDPEYNGGISLVDGLIE